MKMNLDSTWLLDIISHPLFISIASAVVGGLITWILFIKQINWQIMAKHFEDLKTHTIIPWLEGLEDVPPVLRVNDPQLFDDLRVEHYPELNIMWSNWAEADKKEKGEVKALKEEICSRVETLLERAKIKFGRDYKVTPDVCFSGYVVDHIYRILELNSWNADILIEPNPSANIFYVKIDGSEVFRTSNEVAADKVRHVLDMITKTIVVSSDLNERMRCVKELRKTAWEKRSKLVDTLKDLRRKSKLKLRKKFGIFPRPCKYLRS